MVKAYLRYELSSSFGVVSSEANIAFDASGKNVFASALENITLWNLRQSTAVKSFTGPRGAVALRRKSSMHFSLITNVS